MRPAAFRFARTIDLVAAVACLASLTATFAAEPKPDISIIEEKWDKGESFTSGSYWKIGKGGVIYFRPGHETYPIFKQAEPIKFVENAVRFLGAK